MYVHTYSGTSDLFKPLFHFIIVVLWEMKNKKIYLGLEDNHIGLTFRLFDNNMTTSILVTLVNVHLRKYLTKSE